MDKKTSTAVEWYTEKRLIYEKFCDEITAILRELFDDKKITYIDITSRAKTVESFTEKCSKDKYTDPIMEIQDLSGIRITAYTNSEVDKITDILKTEFVIDEANSIDKKKVIEVDRFGYLSVHFVASLRNEYTKIHKYKKYDGLKFEIQVRTLLQHVWSEIEHDRNYKFKGALPKEIKRRFYMIAGVLEMVDKEFDLLTEDITHYANDVERRIENRDFNIELSDTSITTYFQFKYIDIDFKGSCDEKIIEELRNFGIKSILDIDELIERIDKDKMHSLLEFYSNDKSTIGFLRDIMIIDNPDKYFSLWKDNWILGPEDIKYFIDYEIDLESLILKYGIKCSFDISEYEEVGEEEYHDYV